MNLDQRQIKFIFGIIAALFLVIIFVILGRASSKKPPTGTTGGELIIWGTYDEAKDFTAAFSAFGSGEGAGIKLTYVKKDPVTYENALINALAEGRGPDIFIIHNTWVMKHLRKISPAPPHIISFIDFQDAFPTAVVQDFAISSSTYGIPLYLDTLALYYNKDLFDQAGIVAPPKTWAEFEDDVAKLKRVDSGSGAISRAGAAFGGGAKSINRATDIAMMLMMQYGAKMSDPVSGVATFAKRTETFGTQSPAEEAIGFYTKFSNPATPYYTWNDNFANSVDAFSDGRAAMMIGYSYHDTIVKTKNPFLNYGIAPVPQHDPEVAFAFPNYWAFAVSATSKNQDAAWRFLKFLGLRESQAKAYMDITRRPPVLRSLIEKTTGDLRLGIFARQALIARSWQQPDGSAVEAIFADMLDSILTGRLAITEALTQAQQKTQALYRTEL